MGCGASSESLPVQGASITTSAGAATKRNSTTAPDGTISNQQKSNNGTESQTNPTESRTTLSQPSTARTEGVKLSLQSFDGKSLDKEQQRGGVTGNGTSTGLESESVVDTDARANDSTGSLSRQASAQTTDPSAALSRQASVDAEVSSIVSGIPFQRSRTFGRRASFGGGGILVKDLADENAWRQPKHALDLITGHSSEDPHCFRDHLALYWRMENVPTPISAESPRAASLLTNVQQPPDQVFVYLSLGPSSGTGDKLGTSEYRPCESSISFYPMLMPYHSMNGGDPNFSLQIQVWQKRVSTPLSAPVHTSLTLMGYVDVSVINMFSSQEKGQGLLIKPAPSSALNGATPINLNGTMLIVDYIQFYCHTTAAVTAVPSRWPKELCSPQSDCMWRGQIQGIKLSVPRGCPHPNAGGSTAGGLLMQQAANQSGVCFIQFFRLQLPNDEGVTQTAPAASDPMLPTHMWQLTHTTEFLSLSRNPRWSEFQRPLADICLGDYDRPLLLQVILSHDNIRFSEFTAAMPPDSVYSDPAATAISSVKSQHCAVCGISQTISSMRELLAGKTKLKLHAPCSAPLPSQPSASDDSASHHSHHASHHTHSNGGIQRASTFNQESTVANDHEQPMLGLGTLAFSISQIFSSRASLEALARAKLSEIAKSDSTDGFDEVGIVRSTAFLASLLPIARRTHRPGSHLRGPSTDPSSPHHYAHGHASSSGHGASSSPHQFQRSKTVVATSASLLAEMGHSEGQTTAGMSSLLQKMGLADVKQQQSASHDRKGSSASSPNNAKRKSM